MHRYILFFIVLILLTSCGFQPRGPMPLAPPLRTLYLQTTDPYGQLARNLKQYLKMSGVQLTATPKEATTLLAILSEEPLQQLVSASSSQQTRQYNLILKVTFQITDAHGRVLVSPQTVSEMCTLTIQADQILSGSNQANHLYQQMRQAIVYDIMTRLSSQQITSLLS